MKKLIISISCILWVGFIFLNSSQDGEISHERSTKFVSEYSSKIATKLLKYTNLDASQMDIITRKCAHGFEFMILVVILIICFNVLRVNKINTIIYSLFIVLLIATFDETIQLFIPDRTSKVTDILIDFSGGIAGCIIASIFYGVVRITKKIFH